MIGAVLTAHFVKASLAGHGDPIRALLQRRSVGIHDRCSDAFGQRQWITGEETLLLLMGEPGGLKPTKNQRHKLCG